MIDDLTSSIVLVDRLKKNKETKRKTILEILDFKSFELISYLF